MLKSRPTTLAVTLALAYVTWVWGLYGTPFAWVTLGADAEALNLPVFSDEGYDGQFGYYIARDPLGAVPLIDVPAYRYQRILLPALGWLFSFGGNAQILPFVLVGINIIALGVSTYLLEQLLVAHRVSRWYAVGYALSFGVLGTTRLALGEVLAYGLCIGGLWLIQREKLWWSIIPFALAALAKETTLLVSGAVGFHLLIVNRQPSRAVGWGALVLLPFTIWQTVLWQWLGATGIGSGGRGATGFEIIPLMGVVRIWTEGNVQVFLGYMALLFPAVLLPTLWGLWRCWRDTRNSRWTLMTSLLLFNTAIMLFVPFSTYREINGILRFIVGLQLAVIMYAAEHRKGINRPLRYSTLWAFTIVILIASDVLQAP
jgi:hypothetical protein